MKQVCVFFFSGNGNCTFDEKLQAAVCLCDEQHIGDSCGIQCVNGTNYGDGVCTCSSSCDTGELLLDLCSLTAPNYFTNNKV